MINIMTYPISIRLLWYNESICELLMCELLIHRLAVGMGMRMIKKLRGK